MTDQNELVSFDLGFILDDTVFWDTYTEQSGADSANSLTTTAPFSAPTIQLTNAKLLANEMKVRLFPRKKYFKPPVKTSLMYEQAGIDSSEQLGLGS